jgi:hypothetical protein
VTPPVAPRPVRARAGTTSAVSCSHSMLASTPRIAPSMSSGRSMCSLWCEAPWPRRAGVDLGGTASGHRSTPVRVRR